jgi:hypothetical protein
MGKRSGKRIRILLSDGPRTVDLFWVQHTGRDIYYGIKGASAKWSYHKDGNRFYRVDPSQPPKVIEIGAAPPDRFKDEVRLVCLVLTRGTISRWPAYKGGLSDAAAFLDARATAFERPVYVSAGPRRAQQALCPQRSNGG